MSTVRRVGIIAGRGSFPGMVLRGAQREGCSVTVIGLAGLADPELESLADDFYWAGPLRIGRWLRLLRRHAAERVILAGGVDKKALLGRTFSLSFFPDWTTLRMLWRLRDRRNDTALAAVADEFARQGIPMESCVRYTSEDMAQEGVLAGSDPSADLTADIELGWRVAKEMGRLDVGQSIAVARGDVIAVEAIEGTDAMIERAGQLFPKGGWTLVKVAKPDQDMRFDVPTVGPGTIENLRRNGAKALVVEAGRTVIVERDATLRDARAAGIALIGRASTGT